MERRVIKVSNKKEFSVKVYVNENKQETEILKDNLDKYCQQIKKYIDSK